MRYTIALAITLILLSTRGGAQQVNLVPNPSFEQENPGHVPRCTHYSTGTNDDKQDFERDIAYWKIADERGLVTARQPSPDWIGITECHTPGTSLLISNFPYPSERYVQIFACCESADPPSDNDEGVGVGLELGGISYALKPLQKYIFRMKLQPWYLDAWDFKSHVRVHFSETIGGFDNRKEGTELLRNAAKYPMTAAEGFVEGQWYQVETEFVVPGSFSPGVLKNLIIIMEEGMFHVDDIELYEGNSCCPEKKLYELTNNLPSVTHVDQFIRAGFDAGIPDFFGNVIVESSDNVTFKAGGFIDLRPGFSVQPGGIFNSFVQPCTNTDPGPRPVNINIFPNVFTPNGDGFNDRFCIDVEGVLEYSVVVLNRFGIVVFQEEHVIDDVSNFVCLWDGSCNKGFPNCTAPCVVEGVYTVIVSFVNCVGSGFADAQTVELIRGFSGCPTLAPEDGENFQAATFEGGPQKNDSSKILTSSGSTLSNASATGQLAGDIIIYPNPSVGIFIVTTTFPDNSMHRLAVYDISGRLILAEEKDRRMYNIDLSSTPPGIYLLKVTGAHGSRVAKIVRQ